MQFRYLLSLIVLSSFSVSEKGSGISLDIDDVIIHPNYELQAYQDIAVVHLKPAKSKHFFFKGIYKPTKYLIDFDDFINLFNSITCQRALETYPKIFPITFPYD